MKYTQAPFRLALRIEGEWWNAYIAKSDTMEGAILVGSIRSRLVEESKDCKTGFIALMQVALTLAMQEATGLQMLWPEPPHRAPEHERSGTA